MRLLSREEYLMFLHQSDSVPIENTNVKLIKKWSIDTFQPESYSPEEWTVWSFPNRGDWATHVGNYRGNWSPFIPRNLIDRYTKPGDLVCDPMMGSGTTLVECKLMGRNAIGVDINPNAALVAMNRLDFRNVLLLEEIQTEPKIEVFVGDARRLDLVGDKTVDLIATHPPYAGIVPYSNARILGDLSALKFSDFFQEIGRVALECFRILKPGKYCAILMGDTRKHKHFVPIHIGVLGKFLDAGFIMKEDIIKLQHKTASSRGGRWAGHSYDFYKIAHEHLYVFRKPSKDDDLSEYKNSMRWW
ncbi:MAG: methyltransferase domain-containing protein [Nitrososphaerota archaeon]|nr:methyltransferase domain-containing protein [Nitrososphaerota archaeon]